MQTNSIVTNPPLRGTDVYTRTWMWGAFILVAILMIVFKSPIPAFVALVVIVLHVGFAYVHHLLTRRQAVEEPDYLCEVADYVLRRISGYEPSSWENYGALRPSGADMRASSTQYFTSSESLPAIIRKITDHLQDFKTFKLSPEKTGPNMSVIEFYTDGDVAHAFWVTESPTSPGEFRIIYSKK